MYDNMEIKKLLHLFEGKPQKSNITVAILLPRVSSVLASECLHQLFRAIMDHLPGHFPPINYRNHNNLGTREPIR